MFDAPAIEVRGLTKRYKNGVLANDEIDLEVPAGSVFGLLGPNGAGKTTLIRQLTGQLVPSSGYILVNGIGVVRAPHQAKRGMDVVPQDAVPMPFLTPRDHFLNFGRLHGLGRAQVRLRADSMLLQLGLEDHADRIASQLSGGLRRKILVGIALLARPPAARA